METLILSAVLLLSFGWIALEILTAVLIWKIIGQDRKAVGSVPAAVPELPEETESRRLAAEAQRLYEQGFVNLMRYDGSPGRKECEL